MAETVRKEFPMVLHYREEIRPGDAFRHVEMPQSVGVAKADPADPAKLHKARRGCIVVTVDEEKGMRDVPWSINNIEKIPR